MDSQSRDVSGTVTIVNAIALLVVLAHLAAH